MKRLGTAVGAWLALVGAVALGCSDTATVRPDAGEEGGADTAWPGADTITGHDGAGPGPGGEDVGEGGPGGGGDAGEEGGPGGDGRVGPGPDADAGDAGDGDQVPEPVDETPPRVVGAFSADGATITVRFSEDIDPVSGSQTPNFTIFGSDNSQLQVMAATAEGVFSRLELSPSAQINPALTYTLRANNVKDLAGNTVDPQHNSAIVRRSVYLALIWHQHQPLYLDVLRDQLMSPWVRNHATKSYYDMAAKMVDYPDVHLTINLTVVLLEQLRIYLDRLEPFVDLDATRVDADAYFAAFASKTDPWIDLLLRETPSPETATPREIELLYDAPWSCVSVSNTVMQHWPEYIQLRDKNQATYTKEDFLALKIFFVLAWMDPDFLKGPVKMPNGMVVDLSDIVNVSGNDVFTMAVPMSEDLANRLVAESYKIMANVVPAHQWLAYDPDTHEGQIEITTTPYYHPILPLVYNTDEAKMGQPFDVLPAPPFSEPGDAFAQVAKGRAHYERIFGRAPRGMWPAEGSVSKSVVKLFAQNGVEWVATGHDVLAASQPSGQPDYFPYRVRSDEPGSSDQVAVLFRDTTLSDKIGFKFQTYKAQDAANEFVADVLSKAPPFGAKDRMVVVIVDGENAWENYQGDYDAKAFFAALYGTLQEASQVGDIIPVTPTEFIDGNPKRGLPPHPVSGYTELTHLHSGSWIFGNFYIWIGETEENDAWSCLRKARDDLRLSQLPRPNPLAPDPDPSSGYPFYVWRAFESIYAAEGSDWFWWFGDDMTTPANDDTPFDLGFRAHLSGMYEFMNKALVAAGKDPMPVFHCPPIIQATPKGLSGPFTVPPVIDGQFIPNEAEWSEEGAFFFDDDSGAMSNPNDHFSVIYYGYTSQHFYLAISANPVLFDRLGTDYAVALYTSHKNILDLNTGLVAEDPANTLSPEGIELNFASGGAARELRVDFSSGVAQVVLSLADGQEGWTALPSNSVQLGGPTQGGRVLELAIPWSDLNLSVGDPLEMRLAVIDKGQVIDVAPNSSARTVFLDESNAVFVTFEVDVTGNQLPINLFGPINTPPPPSGNGIVFITGNEVSLGEWVPNKIPLLDDGSGSDAVAGDGKWTRTFKFAPGTMLRWKYTVGLNVDEGKWWGTEEFPLTERGYTVPLDPNVGRVIIRDTFADRPVPTGTPGPSTVIEELPN